MPPGKLMNLITSIDRIKTYDWLIFTSRNGVKFFFRRFFEKRQDIRDLEANQDLRYWYKDSERGESIWDQVRPGSR
jgi:uroporphyrinogen-III synthase